MQRTCHQLLAHALRLEEPAVAKQRINLRVLLFDQNIHADFQCRHRGVKLRARKVLERKRAVRQAHKQRPALLHAGDRLAGEVVARNEPAAIGVAL